MPRETEPSLNERSFVLQSLQQNIRVDGRAFDAFRDIELSFGDEYGIADVRLGKTRYDCSLESKTSGLGTKNCNYRVIVRISATVTQPFPDRKFDGLFTVTTEIRPWPCLPSKSAGKPRRMFPHSLPTTIKST